eukprot:1696442-Rhodomonas_salina.1
MSKRPRITRENICTTSSSTSPASTQARCFHRISGGSPQVRKCRSDRRSPSQKSRRSRGSNNLNMLHGQMPVAGRPFPAGPVQTVSFGGPAHYPTANAAAFSAVPNSGANVFFRPNHAVFMSPHNNFAVNGVLNGAPTGVASGGIRTAFP